MTTDIKLLLFINTFYDRSMVRSRSRSFIRAFERDARLHIMHYRAAHRTARKSDEMHVRTHFTTLICKLHETCKLVFLVALLVAPLRHLNAFDVHARTFILYMLRVPNRPNTLSQWCNIACWYNIASCSISPHSLASNWRREKTMTAIRWWIGFHIHPDRTLTECARQAYDMR